MNKSKLKKAVPSLVYLVIAAVFYRQTFMIRQSTSGAMGAITPRTAPRIIIICLVLCAVINLVHDVKREGEAQPLVRVPAKYLVTGFAFVFIALFAKKLGFVICGIVFLFLLFQVLDDQPLSGKRIMMNFLLAAGFAVLFCYGFRYGLNVRIPLYPRL